MADKVKEKKYILRKTFIFIILILICFVLYSKYIGTKGLEVKEYRIVSNKLPVSFSGIKIIHFSDIFYGNTTDQNDLNKISKTINELKPDIIVFTGNLYSNDKKMNKKDKSTIIKFLGSLESNLGKYGVKGYSDYKINIEEIFLESDFKILNNSYELIYNNSMIPIFLGGLPAISKDILDLNKTFEYFNNSEENVKNAEYKILISSEGNAFEKVLKFDNSVNLLLGSSSLNGSVNIPFYGPLYIPKNSNKYYAPYYKLKNNEVFISSGIGTDKIKFRFNNIPSINLYRLKSI